MTNWVLVLIRSGIGFISLAVFVRVLGKKQVSQLSVFDYIIGITIGSTASTLSVELENATFSTWLGMFTWTYLSLIMVWFLRNRLFRKGVYGTPIILIENGKIVDKNLAKLRYEIEDLRMQLRGQGAFNLGDVEFAVYETNGSLSVLMKSQMVPVVPGDLGIQTPYRGLPHELIVRGKVLEEHLKELGLNREWLLTELKKKGIDDSNEVYYAELDTLGGLYISKYGVEE